MRTPRFTRAGSPLLRSGPAAALLLPAALLLSGCGDVSAPEGPLDAATLAPGVVADAAAGPGAVAESGRFIAHLTGAEEVDPVETRAQGQATFRLSEDGSELSYRLIVANIENVHMAHIHLAPVGDNGGVVAWLYPEDGPPPELIAGRTQGVLATGVITSEDLVGPLGDATSLAALVDAMRTGGTYVNVHTTAHPGGEIRGQIR